MNVSKKDKETSAERRTRRLARARQITEDPSGITVLLCDKRRLVAKRHPKPSHRVAHPEFFLFAARRFDSLDAIESFLREQGPNPRVAVITEVPKPGYIEDQKWHRKLVLDDGERKPTLDVHPLGRGYIHLDIDSYDLGYEVDASDEEALKNAVKEVRKLLPEPYREAECVYQWSGSAFVKSGIRLHFWFLLDRPLCDSSLKEWHKQEMAAGRSIKVDLALFHRGQLHYVAFPIFEDGHEDPLKREHRVGRLDGVVERVTLPPEVVDQPAWDAQKKAEEARKDAEREAKDKEDRKLVEEIARSLPKGVRLDGLKSVKGPKKAIKTLRRCMTMVATAPVGERNNTLYTATFVAVKKCGSALGVAMVEEAMLDAWARNSSASEFDEGVSVIGRASARAQCVLEAGDDLDPMEVFDACLGLLSEGDVIPPVPRASPMATTGPDVKPHAHSTGGYMGPIIPGKYIALHADLGSGKSFQIGELSKMFAQVTVVSSRIPNTTALAADFEMAHYQDGDSARTADKAVFTIHSLWKRILSAGGDHLLVLDEVEEIRQTIASGFLRKKTHATWLKLQEIVAGSKRVIVADAHLSEASMQFLGRLGIQPVVQRHEREPPWSAAVRYDTAEDLLRTLFEHLDQGLRCAIATTSKDRAKALADLAEGMPFRDSVLSRENGSIVEIHADMDPETRKGLTEVDRLLGGASFAVYNTAMASGVSFNVRDHFDTVFLLAESWGSRMPDWPTLMQMTSRVRKPSNASSGLHLYVERHRVARVPPREEIDQRLRLLLNATMKRVETAGGEDGVFIERWKEHVLFEDGEYVPADLGLWDTCIDDMHLTRVRSADTEADVLAELQRREVTVRQGQRLPEDEVELIRNTFSSVALLGAAEETKAVLAAIPLYGFACDNLVSRGYLNDEERASVTLYRLARRYGFVDARIVAADRRGKLWSQVQAATRLGALMEHDRTLLLERDVAELERGLPAHLSHHAVRDVAVAKVLACLGLKPAALVAPLTILSPGTSVSLEFDLSGGPSSGVRQIVSLSRILDLWDPPSSPAAQFGKLVTGTVADDRTARKLAKVVFERPEYAEALRSVRIRDPRPEIARRTIASVKQETESYRSPLVPLLRCALSYFGIESKQVGKRKPYRTVKPESLRRLWHLGIRESLRFRGVLVPETDAVLAWHVAGYPDVEHPEVKARIEAGDDPVDALVAVLDEIALDARFPPGSVLPEPTPFPDDFDILDDEDELAA